jgi:hypothetical protein
MEKEELLHQDTLISLLNVQSRIYCKRGLIANALDGIALVQTSAAKDAGICTESLSRKIGADKSTSPFHPSNLHCTSITVLVCFLAKTSLVHSYHQM